MPTNWTGQKATLSPRPDSGLMMGNVVQRGEFAIIDKWHRAQAAVAGADLVIELPTLAGCSQRITLVDMGWLS